MEIYVRTLEINPEIIERLLTERSESFYLDYKTLLDLDDELEMLKLAKHIAAMQVYGGYIIAGADDHGGPTDALTDRHVELLDEQKLKSKLDKYLPKNFAVRTCLYEHDGHRFVGIVTPRNPDGFLVIEKRILFTNPKTGKQDAWFEAGEVYIRDGTSSVRASAEGMREIVNLTVRDRREEILVETRAHQRSLIEEFALSGTFSGQDLPVSWRQDEEVFVRGAARLHTADNRLELRGVVDELSRDACALAPVTHEEGADIGTLHQALDRLTALGVLATRARDWTLLDDVTTTTLRVFNTGGDDLGNLPSGEPGRALARLRVEIAARVVSIGGALVRSGSWDRIRVLVLQLPKSISTSAGRRDTWLRHAVTIGSERRVLGGSTPRTRERGGYLIVRAQQLSTEHISFHPEFPAGDERVLDSLLRFDFLAALVCAVEFEDRVCDTWYPASAYWPYRRSVPLAQDVISDAALRQEVFGRTVSDLELATALDAIGQVCRQESQLGFGREIWGGWGDTVSTFIRSAVADQTAATGGSDA